MTHSFPTRRVSDRQLGLVAVGLTMTWGLTRFANVAHVQFAPVGAYLALVVTGGLGLGLLLGSLVAVAATGAMAVLLHTFFFRRRSEEHTSELQSLMLMSYAVF